MKLLTVVGARPQFIKAAVVSRQFVAAGVEEVLLHTGQHYDDNMSSVFFSEMQIPEPKYNLLVKGGAHGASTGQMLSGIEEILVAERPDAVVVYGDTNSTLAGALAAKKLHVPLVHIEAGLRSFEMRMPEEVNRVLTDRISDILFCPTPTAIGNLLKEGFENFGCLIVNSGDVMQDAALFYASLSDSQSNINQHLGLEKYILCTVHRSENTDNLDNLRSIVSALNDINEQTPVIVPLHPRTRKTVADNGMKLNFRVIDPVGYLDMVQLLKNASLVMTDSGGLQKEAYFFRKHCVTLREQTEWTELVDHGYNIIAGTSSLGIIQAYSRMINKDSGFEMNLYGDGEASQVIADSIVQYFS
jgi:UDP-GlcNAc3NAcA epimerase